MTELEQASVAFFKAVLKTGHDILGHSRFVFNLEASIGTPPEDAERSKLISSRIQEALTFASRHTKSVTIEGTTVQ
jgi:hypothetical protein